MDLPSVTIGSFCLFPELRVSAVLLCECFWAPLVLLIVMSVNLSACLHVAIVWFLSLLYYIPSYEYAETYPGYRGWTLRWFLGFGCDE